MVWYNTHRTGSAPKIHFDGIVSNSFGQEVFCLAHDQKEYNRKNNMVNEKELKEELLLDDLEEAAGGIGVTPDPNKPSGMSCPTCQGFIPVTPHSL